ncbi:type I 3-dehydroquinate dehydratase [Streptococcus sp. DD13]|uniref:type I 3-dehydroquinate dehydratase n=1 Tax=Streptococcus sp. DD13 TaxID=1777881 RepID=UPI000796A0B5|nr:type I 3-dehydroquinate dehydratase [Streptococcus sp. DD13]KXT79167.1 3-dehydroquinate dehydratase I [Streptococcus sp. DD13]
MKIVLPIMPRSIEEVASIDREKLMDADMIEWRADYLPKDQILSVAAAVFELCAGLEVIFTIRTREEGGQMTISSEEYVALIKEVAHIYQPDYLDFEYFTHKDVFSEMLEFPNLILSYHNVEETPENFMELMSELTSLSPAVVKMAVMPKTEQDVLDMMNFTRGFKTLNAEQVFVTVSLGELGKISRLAGHITGSSWTYASLEENKAPGQITISHMKQFLQVLETKE